MIKAKVTQNPKVSPTKFSCFNKHIRTQEAQDKREDNSIKVLELLSNDCLIT